MTYNYFKHGDAPIGVTIQASKTIANMTQAEKDDFEAVAAAKEADLLNATPADQEVWTIDSAGLGFPPRMQRPVT